MKKPVRPSRPVLPLAMQENLARQEREYEENQAPMLPAPTGAPSRAGVTWPQPTAADIARAAALETTRAPLPQLDPLVRALERRRLADPAQLAWDSCRDARSMVKTLAPRHGVGALLGPARWMEETKRMLARRLGGFGNVSKLTAEQTLLSAARLMHGGDWDGAIMFLQPLRRLLMDQQPDAVEAALCEVIRSIFPDAPQDWTAPAAPSPPALPDGGGQTT
jgi:hypothetical protein